MIIIIIGACLFKLKNIIEDSMLGPWDSSASVLHVAALRAYLGREFVYNI